jgi:hypothetical protein
MGALEERPSVFVGALGVAERGDRPTRSTTNKNHNSSGSANVPPVVTRFARKSSAHADAGRAQLPIFSVQVAGGPFFA